MDDIDAKLAGFIAQADQMVATFRTMAEAQSVFYKELLDKGIPEEQATVFTLTNIQSFWQYLAIGHNTPDPEGDN